jgi:hypothetical protein
VNFTRLLPPLALGVLLAAPQTSQSDISGPFTHDNLSIFLIHGPGTEQKYLPLREAMEQKKVIILETGDVNQLVIQNFSNQDVYVQGGDIIKGGQQDRVLPNDFVLPPKSGKVPISSFCVEQGRWSRRGKEEVVAFTSAKETVSSNAMKVAVNSGQSQTRVWDEVAVTQGTLELSPGVADSGRNRSVRSAASPSSLQLTLESAPVTTAVEAYVKALNGVIAGKKDVVGLAVAINGKMNSADVYASPELFTAMWPKLLKSAAVEAVRLLDKEKSSSSVSVESVRTFLRGIEAEAKSTVEVGKRVKVVTRETGTETIFESLDGGNWIHRNYVGK